MIERFSSTLTFKNMSIILCGMKNFEETLCLECQGLELPFGDVAREQKESEEERDDVQF